MIASADRKEDVRLHDELLTITGTLLDNNSNSPFLMIKSNDYIYQVRRDRALASEPEVMDVGSSKLELSIPIEDVESIWTTKFVKTIGLKH